MTFQISKISIGLTCLLATAGSLVSAHANEISDALQKCLDGAIVEQKSSCEGPTTHSVKVTRVPVDGTCTTVFMLTCSNEPARRLFEALKLYEKPSTMKWHDLSTVETSYFGIATYPSGCNHRTRTDQGEEMSYYWCNIAVDLKPSIAGVLTF